MENRELSKKYKNCLKRKKCEKTVKLGKMCINYYIKQFGVLLPKYNLPFTRYVCRGPIQGFKIILTAPGEELKFSRHSFR